MTSRVICLFLQHCCRNGIWLHVKLGPGGDRPKDSRLIRAASLRLHWCQCTWLVRVLLAHETGWRQLVPCWADPEQPYSGNGIIEEIFYWHGIHVHRPVITVTSYNCHGVSSHRQDTNLTNLTIHLFHIPQYTTLEQKHVQFCSKVVYCWEWVKCIVVSIIYSMIRKHQRKHQHHITGTLWRESINDWLISLTQLQYYGKRFHVITSHESSADVSLALKYLLWGFKPCRK